MALTSVKQRMAPVPGSPHRERPAPSGNIQAAKRGPDATQRPSPAWNSDSPLPRTAEEGDTVGAFDKPLRHSGARAVSAFARVFDALWHTSPESRCTLRPLFLDSGCARFRSRPGM